MKCVADVDTKLCFYEKSLVNYNVFHSHEDNEGELYVPVKYDIGDLTEQHIEGKPTESLSINELHVNNETR